MNRYRRHLPHWDLPGQPVFVTFRLHGSLPLQWALPGSARTSGDAFTAADRLLDTARSGPRFLRQPEVARLIVEALVHGDAEMNRYRLHAFAVMPNHVHLLTTPAVPMARWLGPLKGYTAHRATHLLKHEGPFWQNESFDHIVRNTYEFRRIQRYIEWNPVKAGLATAPQDFPWSSASELWS